MAQNTFDVVSKVDLPEVQNAIQQAIKEIQQRYDLKATKSEIEFDAEAPKIILRCPDEFVLQQVSDVLQQKLVRRQVPTKALNFSPPRPAAGSSVVQDIELQQGIPIEKAREIVKAVKVTKIKVQAAIQGDQIRISGKNRDDLQDVMAALKAEDFGIDMQFTNYR